MFWIIRFTWSSQNYFPGLYFNESSGLAPFSSGVLSLCLIDASRFTCLRDPEISWLSLKHSQWILPPKCQFLADHTSHRCVTSSQTTRTRATNPQKRRMFSLSICVRFRQIVVKFFILRSWPLEWEEWASPFALLPGCFSLREDLARYNEVGSRRAVKLPAVFSVVWILTVARWELFY